MSDSPLSLTCDSSIKLHKAAYLFDVLLLSTESFEAPDAQPLLSRMMYLMGAVMKGTYIELDKDDAGDLDFLLWAESNIVDWTDCRKKYVHIV